MVKPPVLSGYKIIKILNSVGFEIVGRCGSHVRLKKKTLEETRIVIVPLHKEVSKGTFASILRQSGIVKKEFMELCKK